MNENSSAAANKRTPKKETTPYDEQSSSEYKRTICLSAERARKATMSAGASKRKHNVMS